MQACNKLILWFWWRWSSIRKFTKIARLPCFYNTSKRTLEMKLVFLHADTHHSFLQADFSIARGWCNHYWWEWSINLKVLKVTSSQYLYSNIKKKVRNKVHLVHADEHQRFHKLTLSFLLEAAIYAKSTQNKNLVILLQYMEKKKHCYCFCQLLWFKTFRYFTGVQSFSLLFVFEWLRWKKFRSWDCKTRCIPQMIWWIEQID